MSTALLERTDGLTGELAETLRTTRAVLTLADGGREPAYRQAFPVALWMAELAGAHLLLVDRSRETWADTPHHRGPYGPEVLRTAGMHHLDWQLHQATEAGVSVGVWVPSLPLPETYLETLEHNVVDLAVLPQRFVHPTFTERLMGTHCAKVARVLNPSVPVVEVMADGSFHLL